MASKCKTCDGVGQLPQTLPDTARKQWRDCPDCDGLGVIHEVQKSSGGPLPGEAPAGEQPPHRQPAGAVYAIHTEAMRLALAQFEIDVRASLRAMERAFRDLERINALLGGRQ